MLSRRRFLLAGFGLGAGGWLAAIVGCGGESGPPPTERARSYDPDLECSDVAGLWPAEVKTRTDNAYRERSDQPDRYCFNCTNFEPAGAREVCGSCRTVKGPINPLGYCESWTEKRR